MRKKESHPFFLLLLVSVLFFGVFAVRVDPFRTDSEAPPCDKTDFSGNFLPGERIAYFEGREIPVALASFDKIPNVLGDSNAERWIEVDLSEQKLRAWEGDQLFLESAVSTGLPYMPTPTGEFRIWTKFRFTKMEGGRGTKDYYYLPNVPFVMFFENSEVPGFKGYGLHGTYWHNDFGRQRSHGCVNLPTPIAEKLYYWTTPTLTTDQKSKRATEDDPGTRILIHE